MPSRPYDSFALLYDAAGFGRFSADLCERLTSHWLGILPLGAWVADLGAGQGTAAKVLGAEGFRVVSLDLSMAMLRKARGMKIQADMRSLPLRPGFFNAALCLYDAINHIPGADLPGFLGQAVSILKPGGRFAFDANTLAGSRMWTETTCTIRKKGVSLEVASEFDAGTGHMRNRVRGWKSDGVTRRKIDETIEEWYHPRPLLEALAREAGLKRLQTIPMCMDSENPDEPSKWLYEFELAS